MTPGQAAPIIPAKAAPTAAASQVTRETFSKMSFTAKMNLSRALNRDGTKFVPCVDGAGAHLKIALRKKDAVVAGKASRIRPNGQFWCPYCGGYEPFRKVDGYPKCVGCGMSTKDFYTRIDNNLG